ncbi:nucleoside hydrolase [Naasia lichenicola]|uniref:Nucleoside hydrolase n=1 Tax=Naasia lichenicola TaxID=2565933 RepID=A0A4S4FGL0_9MICO|nr:nucleoside hydrolase [Naasia lichenicola]THG29400.1 nucleoside hydrolase [Naasia lichenicola]
MTARMRVIVDNDFSGDPDDLFQLAHHVLSPSVEIPFVIGSHLKFGDFFDPSETQAENAAAIARDLLTRLGSDITVLTGSNTALPAPSTPVASTEAADAIIAEAMREDTDLPLYIVLGAGMTELASAWLKEPRIGSRLTAIWIGGPEHEGIGTPLPVAGMVEYNLAIDIPSVQVVFNESDIPVWQVPRNAYRQALVSWAEIDHRLRPTGALGSFLADSLDRVRGYVEAAGRSMGETYCLGDSPLVLLTALQTAFEPGPASSDSVVIPTPIMNDEGWYEDNPDGRPLRVFTALDNRLMFEDMFHKFAAFDHAPRRESADRRDAE